jgi:hypothetical protein
MHAGPGDAPALALLATSRPAGIRNPSQELTCIRASPHSPLRLIYLKPAATRFLNSATVRTYRASLLSSSRP